MRWTLPIAVLSDATSRCLPSRQVWLLWYPYLVSSVHPNSQLEGLSEKSVPHVKASYHYKYNLRQRAYLEYIE